SQDTDLQRRRPATPGPEARGSGPPIRLVVERLLKNSVLGGAGLRWCIRLESLVFGWRSASSAAVVRVSRSLLGRCNSPLSGHNSLSLWLFAALPEMIAS